MTQSRGKGMKRTLTPPRRGGPEDDGNRRPRDQQQRFNGDHRSKEIQVKREGSPADFKGKAHMRSPPPRKRKAVEVMSDSTSEDERVADHSAQLRPSKHAWSSGYASPNDNQEGEAVPFGVDRNKTHRQPGYKEDGTLIKPVELDVQGVPHGSMMTSLSTDVKQYAKALDPTCSWEAQPASEKYRLFRRLYSDWEMEGQSKKVSEKWMAPLITKVLITTRFRLNALIDDNSRRPPEVTSEQWETLVRIRKSEASVQKSEHMRSISKGKGSKALQLRAIERDAIIKLSILHKRAPYASEIAAEVGLECQRQEEDKVRGNAERNSDFSDMRSRIADIEGTVTRLEEKMDAAAHRMEDMVMKLLNNLTPNAGISPAPVVVNSVHTETTETAPVPPFSPLLPSNRDRVADPNVNVQDVQLEEQSHEVDDGEFVNTLFADGSPNGSLPSVVIHEGCAPVIRGDDQRSMDESLTSGGHGSMLNERDEYAIGAPVRDSFVIDMEGNVAEEMVCGEKEVGELAGDSAGRARRSIKNLQALKASKAAAASKASKLTTAKSTSTSKVSNASTKQTQQPKKLEATKKK